MPRYKLTIAYDGTHFCGWQKQEPYAPGSEPNPDPESPTPNPAPPPRDLPTSHAKTANPPPAIEKIIGELALRDGETKARVALRTVQHIVEQAVRQVVRERVNLDGASRTDAGVHARGQVAAFTCSGKDEETERQRDGVEVPSSSGAASETIANSDTTHPASPPADKADSHTGWPISRGTDRLVRALNGKLPDDIVVMSAQVVREDFNPVRDATSKAYSYTIHNARERAMWDRNYVHHIYEPLDVAAMQQAAAHFVGEHDFVAFAAANHGRLTTVRTVFSCAVSQSPAPLSPAPTDTAPGSFSPRRIRIDISGSGFLYNMVRIISGTLVEVGRGRMKPDAIPTIIAGLDRRAAGPTLPGRGLCLEWIRYA